MLKTLKSKLFKTHNKIAGSIESALGLTSREAALELIEESLITSDMGVATAVEVVEKLKERTSKWDEENIKNRLSEIITEILLPCQVPLEINSTPFVIMVLGINGAGKTTTIGKLAAKLNDEGKKVFIGACDTFRAAAIEQLEAWAEKSNARVIKHREGSDPGAVAFDTIKAAASAGADVVIIDTAGRLHTNENLMEELKKIRRICEKETGKAPDEVMLILDGQSGQNATVQVREFSKAMDVTGLVITKLDGSAKGGVLVSIAKDFSIPIRFIGVGESVEDLRVFSAEEFSRALV